MKIDETRLAKQEEALLSWRNFGGNGCIIAATGFGKTYLGILAMKKISANPVFASETLQFLVIVPTSALKEQWGQECKLHGINNVTILTRNSWKLVELSASLNRFKLIIYDEVHGLATKEFSGALELTSKFKLGLTATLERPDGNHYMITKVMPVVYKVSLNDAVNSGWVSNYKIQDIKIELENHNQIVLMSNRITSIKGLFNVYDNKEYGIIKRKVTNLVNVLNEDKTIDNNTKETLTLKINEYNTKLDLMRPVKIIQDGHEFIMERLKKKYLTDLSSVEKNMMFEYQELIQKRRILIANDDAKIRETIKLLRENTKKTIVFCEFIETANKIMDEATKYRYLKAACYTSKMPQKQRNSIIDGFKKGIIRTLITVKALDEGLNVPSCSTAIIVANTGQPRQFKQRLGRVIRAKKNKVAVVYRIIGARTMDEVWTKASAKYN